MTRSWWLGIQGLCITGEEGLCASQGLSAVEGTGTRGQAAPDPAMSADHFVDTSGPMAGISSQCYARPIYILGGAFL